MLPQEILAQVRRLEISTRRLVAESFAGDYHSVFKGRGMEFAEVREYAPGDDPRDIDRNVSARTGKPFVRRYTEERELTVMIAVDLSGSLGSGTAARLKRDAAAEAAAALAFSALLNNDKVGLMLFTDQVELYLPPRKGRRHVLRAIRELLAFEPASRGTALAPALDRLARAIKRRCVLVLISDFQDEGYERALKLCALKHEVVPVRISDPSESALPDLPAFLSVEDPETGVRRDLDLRAEREGMLRARRAGHEALKAALRSCALEAVEVSTARPTLDPLLTYFRRRAARRRS